MPGPRHRYIPLEGFPHRTAEEQVARAERFFDEMKRRRSVRDFSPEPIDRRVIEACLRTAGSAPSGANQQPWHFVAVSDPETRRQIREQAEAEEREFYEHRATEAWLDKLRPLGTDANKPFLETAPCLIVIFAKAFGETAAGERERHYYVAESVGIATGLLISAIHHAGLVSLTHTPSPMRFLNGILERPSNERPYMILVVGHPAEGVEVPAIERKSLDEIASFR